jgi:WD40 repeat protein
MFAANSGNKINLFDVHLNNKSIEDNDESLIYCMYPISFKKIFSAGLNGKIKLWDTEFSKVIKILDGHTANVRSLEVSNFKLYSSSADDSFRIWDINTCQCNRINAESCVQNTLK